MYEFAVEAKHVCKATPTKRNRVSHDCLEHRLRVIRRSAYDAKNLRGRHLLPTSLVQFAGDICFFAATARACALGHLAACQRLLASRFECATHFGAPSHSSPKA